MRPTRLITALIAVLVMLGASLSVGSASATEGISTKGTSAQATTAARAKPAHRLTAKGYEYGNTGKFFVRGKVTTFRGKVRLQRARCEDCRYKTFKTGRTNSRGKFKINFDGKVGTNFRIAVPATKKRRTTVKWFGAIVAGN
jgi:hypothetical protein